MPLFEYKCPSCGKTTEVLMKYPDYRPDQYPCEHCGELADWVYSRFNFAFSPFLKELREGNMI